MQLNEVVRENDKLVINLLNKIWVGNIDDNVDWKDLYMNLMEIIQNIPCTCIQRIKLLWKGRGLF